MYSIRNNTDRGLMMRSSAPAGTKRLPVSQARRPRLYVPSHQCQCCGSARAQRHLRPEILTESPLDQWTTVDTVFLVWLNSYGLQLLNHSSVSLLDLYQVSILVLIAPRQGMV